MALYAYKKQKVKSKIANIKKNFWLPMFFLISGMTILGIVSYPYISYYTAQILHVDNFSKEYLSPSDSFIVSAAENTANTDNYDQNASNNISTINQQIRANSIQYQDLSTEKGIMYITIDKIGIKDARVNINTNSSSESEYNPVLWNNLAHFKGTSLPGHAGKTFIYGHSSREILADASKSYIAMFSNLDKLNLGDEFSIKYKEKTYKYTIIRVKLANKDNISVIFGDNRKTVSLMTCAPAGIGSERLIVEALQQEV